MTHADDLERLGESTRQLLHTVAGMPTTEWAAPSLLPDWSRAHVVAHLVLNAEGMAGAVEGVLHDEPVPMYTSQEDRDADIETLAGEPAGRVRERLEGASARLGAALSALTPDLFTESFERVSGGPRWPVAEVSAARRREVEIHHADLGLDYTCAQWPTDFGVEVLDRLVADRAGQGPFTVEARDLARHWQVGGPDGPVVSGRACELAWWLLGRGGESALRCDTELPVLGAWR